MTDEQYEKLMHEIAFIKSNLLESLGGCCTSNPNDELDICLFTADHWEKEGHVYKHSWEMGKEV